MCDRFISCFNLKTCLFILSEQVNHELIYIFVGLKASLERLQLDYVDIVFANKPDPHTPMEGK